MIFLMKLYFQYIGIQYIQWIKNTQNVLKTIVINVLKHKNTILTSWKAFKMTYFGKLLNKS